VAHVLLTKYKTKKTIVITENFIMKM